MYYGDDYRDERFIELSKQDGFTQHFTMKKTPQQNDATKRMNQTLMERERCMRLHAGLLESCWEESVNRAAYLVNRCPSKLLNSSAPRKFDQVRMSIILL